MSGEYQLSLTGVTKQVAKGTGGGCLTQKPVLGDSKRNVAVVLPAYEPDKRLVGLVERLKGCFRAVLVVNDGSRGADEVFAALPAVENVHLIVHPVNLGKGMALKTAFAEVLRRFPDIAGVVTADADGQHLVEDIRRVADALLADPGRMVLGVRTFRRNVPFRSRFGNLWTIAEFFLLTGRIVRDTQSGLRGLPRLWLSALAKIPGRRYDYEIGVLVAAVRTLGGVAEIPIATVYDPGNATSHYRPLVDTVQTQWALLRAALCLTRSRLV